MASWVDPQRGSAPILLVGLPRSGTTWIGKIFDSHRSTLYLHEPDTLVPIREKEIPLIADGVNWTIGPEELNALLARTLNVRLTGVAGSLPRFPKDYRNWAVDWMHRKLAVALKLSSHVLPDLSLPDLLRRERTRKVRLVWKSIFSVGRIGLIARLMPEFRIIQILRHPGGWMTSYSRGHREHWFTSQRDDWQLLRKLETTPLARRQGLTLESFRGMSDLERNTWLWLLWNESGAEATDGLPNVTTVIYEDLCAAPFELSRRLFDFAGLEWQRQTEAFIKRSVTTQRGGYYSLYRDPSTAANKWRSEVSPEELRVVESIMNCGRVGERFLK